MDTVEYRTIPVLDESIVGSSHEQKISKEELFAIVPMMGELYSNIFWERNNNR